jgi:glycyl-tRNA synthetase (class II)
VTPEVVLRASGHVERFTDFMVTDALTHDCHRADHLLEAALEARLADAAAPPSADEREVGPRGPCPRSPHVMLDASALAAGLAGISPGRGL